MLLFPLTIFGQEVKEVVHEKNNSGESEDYYVLKSDPNIKHGRYRVYGYKKALLVNGYYKNGEKDSLWTTYYWGGKVMETKGSYSHGKLIGTWDYYTYDGKLDQQYNYDSSKVVFARVKEEDANKKVRVISGADTVVEKLDRVPIYIGGSVMGTKAFSEIRYPAQAKDNGIQGTVMVSFFIDTNGKASHHHVQKGIGGGCDEEALKAVKRIPDNWVPAVVGGKAVTVEWEVPVMFRIN